MRKAFIWETFWRIARKERRTRLRKSTVAAKSTGSTAKETSASRALIASIATTTPSTVKRSPKTVIAPVENSSWSTSTSEPTRVMSRPVGVRSKNASGWASMRSKTARRRSIIACWPMR